MKSKEKKYKVRPRDIIYLESLLRSACFTRDKWRCLRCKRSDKKLNMSHIKPKGRYSSLRFEFWNVKTLCVDCHMNFWHKDPLDAGRWFESNYPQWANKVRLMSQDTNRPKFDYERIKQELLKLKRDERPY